MKKLFLALSLALVASGCTSVETARVAASEFPAAGGEAVGVIQVNTIGFTALFHMVDIVSSDLDQVTKMLVDEAKGMGASKVDVKGFSTTPRHGIFAVFSTTGTGLNLLSFTFSNATGVAVK
jgi:uncharacterized protein YceK